MEIREAIKQDMQARRNGIAPAKKSCIAVLTPTLGQVSMWWATCMLDLLWPMNCGKSFIPCQDTHGDQVGEMRNRLVSMALAFEAQQGINLESIAWIDDDVIFNRALILELAQHDCDIASGVYFSKSDPAEPLIFDGPSSGTGKFRPDETFESWGYAQGLSLVKTSVYKRMRDELELEKDKYGLPCWYKQPEFGMNEAGELSLGGTEDFWFFENASKLGIRPLVCCTKLAFGFHYDAKEKFGYPRKQWEQWVRREPIVWPLKEGGEVVWG